MSVRRRARLTFAVLTAALAAAVALSLVSSTQAAPPAGCHQLDGTVTCTFASTGAEQQFTVPAGVTNLHVAAIGAAGGHGSPVGSRPATTGGAGGKAEGDVAVQAGDVVYVEVGGAGGIGGPNIPGTGGFNGGGNGGSYQGGGGGGGASDVRLISCGSSCPGDVDSLHSRLLAGGGGGGGAANRDICCDSGGGGTAGTPGTPGAEGFLASSNSPTGGNLGGGAGTSNNGGAGGTVNCGGNPGGPNGLPGADGGLGTGGEGGTGNPTFPGGPISNGPGDAGGGGGGAGLWGGGGGASAVPRIQCGAGGGGGGYSYISGSSLVSNGSTSPSGGAAPTVTITYTAQPGSSAIYYVASDGSGTDCAANSESHPFARIQDALACAGDGDVISVAPSDTPYPGIGTVANNVTIKAATRSVARGVPIDLSQPDNSSGTLTVAPGASVDVEDVTLECLSHQCAHPNVTNKGRLVLRGVSITGAGLAVAVLNQSTSSSQAQLSIFNSTIAHNTDANGGDSSQGGGLEMMSISGPASTAKIVNSTIADNVSGTGSAGHGGGIFVSDPATLSLKNVTIAHNTATGPFGGGGIYVPAGSTSTVTIDNTLIAQNKASTGGPDCQGAVSDGSGGHNLIGVPTGCSGVSDGANGDQVGVAGPGVSPPADNGGPTDTARLQQQSPAIGQADATTCQSSDVADRDQRGFARSSATRGVCDVGAYDTGTGGGTAGHNWHVAPAGSGTACAANSSGHPFARVQDALACAGDGDTITLAPSGSTPYPGIGPVNANVTIQAASGADARSVHVDLSQPDNSSGTMTVSASSSVIVKGVTLDCVSHACTSANVTNHGLLALRDDTVTGAGLAVGVFNDTGSLVPSRLTVVGSAIVHNSNDGSGDRSQGGGIQSVGATTAGTTASAAIFNSTIADNSSGAGSGGQGGGVMLGIPTSLTLTNVTIAQNTSTGLFGGGGIYVPAGSAANTVVASNTLIAGNSSAHAGSDCQGQISDGTGGHNLIGSSAGCSGVSDGTHGDQVGVADPHIGAVGSNGGPTETAALHSLSPAIGGGDSGTCGSQAIGDVDQRGIARHSSSRSACDIGAYDTGGANSSGPTITLTTPVDAAHYMQGTTVNASYSCSDPDGPADVKSCRGHQGGTDLASGAAVDTSTVGDHTFTVDASDQADHTASKSVTYTVDAPTPPQDTTAPTITITSPVNGTHYTQGQAVNAAYACHDEAAGSGVKTCRGHQGSTDVASGGAIDTSTTGPHTFTVDASDQANNPASQSVTYTVDAPSSPPDKTPPTITVTTPADGAHYNQGATVRANYSCHDNSGGSGVKTCHGTVAANGAIDTGSFGRHTLTVSATDRAGNSASKTVAYTVLDRSAPSTSINTPRDGAHYSQWQTVKADYSCRDNSGGSGVKTCHGTVAVHSAIDTRTAGRHSFSVSAVDQAGNSSSKTVTYWVIDRSAPSISITTPTQWGHYGQRQTVKADFSCRDNSGGSGVKSCHGTVGQHSPIDTKTVGWHSFTVSAVDQAGNRASTTVHYFVYPTRGKARRSTV